MISQVVLSSRIPPNRLTYRAVRAGVIVGASYAVDCTGIVASAASYSAIFRLYAGAVVIGQQIAEVSVNGYIGTTGWNNPSTDNGWLPINLEFGPRTLFQITETASATILTIGSSWILSLDIN